MWSPQPSGKMEVLKVKVDFKQPSSGSVAESPKIWMSVFKPKTIIGYLYIQEQKNKLQILKNNPLFEQKCDVRKMYY